MSSINCRRTIRAMEDDPVTLRFEIDFWLERHRVKTVLLLLSYTINVYNLVLNEVHLTSIQWKHLNG